MGLAGGEAGRQRGGIIVDTSAFSGDPHCISKELPGGLEQWVVEVWQ